MIYEFELCEGCPKCEGNICTVYYREGQIDRLRNGYCPFRGTFASNYKGDYKPVKAAPKKRIGQQKQRG